MVSEFLVLSRTSIDFAGARFVQNSLVDSGRRSKIASRSLPDVVIFCTSSSVRSVGCTVCVCWVVSLLLVERLRVLHVPLSSPRSSLSYGFRIMVLYPSVV